MIAAAAASSYVFNAPGCNTNANNPANYIGETISIDGHLTPSKLTFGGADGSTEGHVFQPLTVLLNTGSFAVGTIDIPEGLSFELEDGASFFVEGDAASGPAAVMTAGQFVKPECNVNCADNWRKYQVSGSNPQANPALNPAVNFNALSIDRVPCVSVPFRKSHRSKSNSFCL